MKLIPLRKSKSFFPLEIKIIFLLFIHFHLLDVPLLAEPLGRISIEAPIYLKKGRALSDSTLSCSQSASV